MGFFMACPASHSLTSLTDTTDDILPLHEKNLAET